MLRKFLHAGALSLPSLPSLPSLFGLVAALLIGLAALAGADAAHAARTSESAEIAGMRVAIVTLAELPAEARETLALIVKGGPFPYAKDGTVFGNYERALPKRKRGYYLEFTVPTPGLRNRGPRRIVAGKGEDGDVRTSGEYWYTADHYRTFRLIIE